MANKIPIVPLLKAEGAKKPAKKASASGPAKPKNTGSHVYMPSPGGLGKQVKEGDVTEFHHPKHGRKHRGRVTAVGQDGYRARIADGSAVDVPHTHHIATLPTGDFGTEQGLSPQDAKEAFLGPTREGGLPATDLQVAILDVMAQHGFPIDEQTITKINYDDAQKMISKFIMDDASGERSRGPDSDTMQPGGSEAKDGTDQAPPTPGGPPGDDEEQPEGGDEQEPPAPGGDEGEVQPNGGLPEDQEPEGQSSAPTGDIGQAPNEQDEDQPTDGTDAQDATGPEGGAGPDSEEQGVDPEVIAAIQKLIAVLEASSEAAGKKSDKPITGKGSSKK